MADKTAGEFPTWRTPEGEPVSCVEKIKVLNENLAELHDMAQDALEDAVLMGADEAQKSEFLGNAAGLIFPIAWREPFGLAMIEAMACGTPVIAMNRGSVPEVIEEGVSGFIVENEDEAIAATHKLKTLDRARVREAFDRRFTGKRMAEDYVQLYERLATADRPLLKFA